MKRVDRKVPRKEGFRNPSLPRMLRSLKCSAGVTYWQENIAAVCGRAIRILAAEVSDSVQGAFTYREAKPEPYVS